ncbi:hypothetical protein ACPC54_18550 [Kitasatospora sp. NPDC094028]
MTTEQAAIDSAVKAIVAAASADDSGAFYKALMPPAGKGTPPAEAATWFGSLLIHLALTTATASKLERGCPRETVSAWINDVLGPLPTPAQLRAEDPGRIDHVEAVRDAADYARCHEYAVDLIRVGLAAPGEDLDERGVDAHHAVVNDKKAHIIVTRMLARLTAAAGVRG